MPHRTLLCTAEAFGFGPAAALNQILPHLRRAGCDPVYMGSGWTLEMHTDDMYREVHDVDVRSGDGPRRWREALRKSGAMLSVCDLQAADIGAACGAATVLYEVLAWFRRPAPETYKRVHLVCPDFFGVREALRESGITHAQVVPPLMPRRRDESDDGTVLVNLGGLQTPYSSLARCAQYAQSMVDAVRAVFGAPLVLTSHAVAEHLRDCEVRTVGPVQARALLARARFAFLTGGIGNMMDAAGLAARVCFLPPMSQSQGLQLALLRRNVNGVPTLAWHEITRVPSIDYHAEHEAVMPAIADRIAATAEASGTEMLRACMRRIRDALEQPGAGRTLHDAFLARFGRDDGRAAAGAIVGALARATGQHRKAAIL